MHELSIAVNILDTVEENALKHGACTVTEVELEVGELSGIEFDALDFAFQNAPVTKIFQDTVFKVLRIKPIARCHDCKNVFETNNYATPCPACQSIKTELIKGNELRIKSFSYD